MGIGIRALQCRIISHGARNDGGVGDSTNLLVNGGCESSAFQSAGLSPRPGDSGVVCTWRSAEVPVSIASWDPAEVLAGLANVARAERPRLLKASSVDGPVEQGAKTCTVPEPLGAVIVEASGRLITPAGQSAMVDKSQRCSSRRDIEASRSTKCTSPALQRSPGTTWSTCFPAMIPFRNDFCLRWAADDTALRLHRA